MEYKPLIIIIDLDGTIIGDITPQLIAYEISRELKFMHKFSTKDFQYKLQHGIIRPGFKSFIKNVKRSQPNIEFFIYTASEKTWANFVIKQIETALHIKFNRPIFNRDDCILDDSHNEYQKCIKQITPRLFTSVHKKYPILKKDDLLKRVLIIDNNSVYRMSDEPSLVLCSTYDYKHPENMILYLTRHDYEQQYHRIHHIFGKYIKLKETSNWLKFQRLFYTYFLNQLLSCEKNNARYLQDTFWITLEQILVNKKFSKFGSKTVSYINQKSSFII